MTITFPNTHGDNEVYTDCLNALLGTERGSFVDCGCNLAPFTSQLGFKRRLYVDILHRELDCREDQPFFKEMDCLKLESLKKHWDVLFSLDHLEHLSRMDGFKFLNMAKRVSDRQIIFTPLDWWMKAPEDNTDPEAHHSLWTPHDLSPEWFHIVFPRYHELLNIGGWFGYRSENLAEDFERVCAELETKSWAKEMEVTQ